MFLLSGNDEKAPEVWTARATLRGGAHEVLAALTDPREIAAWSPIGFELEDPDARTLEAGCHQRVCGSLAGVKAFFEVDVARAELGRLELVAEGPLAMDVAYRFREQGGRVVVDASVGLRRSGGLTAQILCKAAAALLNAGALDRALQSLGDSLCGRPEREPELAAA